MVQQTKDSTFTEYWLAHAESGLSNSGKQLSASVAAKKSELQDSCNENPIMVSKSIGSPHLMEDGECTGGVKISGMKRSLPECRQFSKSNAGNGHIVYVRRKPEADLSKSNFCDTQSDSVDCPNLKKSTDQGETTQQLTEMNDPVIYTSDAAPLQKASSPSFSSTRGTVSPSLVVSSNIFPPENIKPDAHDNCANQSSEDPRTVNVMFWEERYCRFQKFLEMLDRSDKYDYVQMLRSLSSVELSRHAVELEKRSIKLSLEEAKEMQRVRSFDVLGTHGKNVRTPSSQQK